MANLDCRAAAAKALFDLMVHGHSLSTVIPKWQARVSVKDRALLQELVYGVARWHGRLDALLSPLLRKPFKRKDGDIQALLMVGLYQLLYLRVPDHAAVSATVNATRGLDKAWAKNLCNAVLRRFQRERETLLAAADEKESARYAHPDWLLGMLKKAYPDHWQAIAQANNEHPPMTLRINRRRTSRQAYLELLAEQGIAAHAAPFSDVGITLDRAVDVAMLPGFGEGWASVQDGAAQLAAPLLDLKPGQRVLDACAAPGGKTAHVLEREAALDSVLAIDEDAQRVARLKETLARLELSANLKTADAAAPQRWWDGKPFDRILLDAPCSATGVIRRHPDIKLLRRATDIEALVALQQRILTAMWSLLAAGGKLLYVTCSVLPRENHLQLQQFLAQHRDAVEQPIDAPWGHQRAVGRQILPGESDMDGFYYACICKR